MIRPVWPFSTNAKKMLYEVFSDSCNDDSWGSDKVVGGGGHYLRAQEVNGQHLQNGVAMWSQKVATGKSLISLKTVPSPKICFTCLFIQLFTFSSHLFSLFQKVKSSQNCAIFLKIVYKIFHFNIQLTAKIQRKPKTNMQRWVDF